MSDNFVDILHELSKEFHANYALMFREYYQFKQVSKRFPNLSYGLLKHDTILIINEYQAENE